MDFCCDLGRTTQREALFNHDFSIKSPSGEQRIDLVTNSYVLLATNKSPINI